MREHWPEIAAFTFGLFVTALAIGFVIIAHP